MQLSVVVPVYRSAECLPELVSRIQQELGARFERYELILVNDHSPDRSWEAIVQLSDEYDFVIGVNLRKNVGQDNAIMAGLRHASGKVVVIMDDDLQHDPGDIASLYSELSKGYDVVYANFERKEQALWKNFGSWFTDRVAVLILGKPKDIYMSPFKAIRRDVVDTIVRYEGPYSYVDGLIFTITSAITQIDAKHHRRFAGTGNYNLRKSLRVWLKLTTSFSVIPLRIATLTGAIISLVSFGLACFFIFETLFLDKPPAGWPSLIVTVLFLAGIQLLGLGAVGEYVGRIFITQNRRPQFAIKEVRGRRRSPSERNPEGR